MTKSEVVKAIKSAKKVFAYVQISRDSDGSYVRVTKEYILQKLEGYGELEVFNVQLSNNSEKVYIN